MGRLLAIQPYFCLGSSLYSLDILFMLLAVIKTNEVNKFSSLSGEIYLYYISELKKGLNCYP